MSAQAMNLYEILANMRGDYEANRGYPISAGNLLCYERRLRAVMKQICPMKNANMHRDANEAFREWKETHEAPENPELPPWVKDFVNWMMADAEENA